MLISETKHELNWLEENFSEIIDILIYRKKESSNSDYYFVKGRCQEFFDYEKLKHILYNHNLANNERNFQTHISNVPSSPE